MPQGKAQTLAADYLGIRRPCLKRRCVRLSRSSISHRTPGWGPSFVPLCHPPLRLRRQCDASVYGCGNGTSRHVAGGARAMPRRGMVLPAPCHGPEARAGTHTHTHTRGFGAVLRSHNVAMIRQQALMRQPPAQALWLAIQASAAPASGHPACLAMSHRSAKAAEGYYASLLLHRTVRYRCCRRPPRAPATCAARTALAVRPASAPRRSKQRPALSVRLGRRTCAVVLGVCGPSPPPTSMREGSQCR